jgi:hypothetical protein
MASKAIKRRPISAETDKTGEKQMDTALSDPVTEPLLGNTPQEEKSKVCASPENLGPLTSFRFMHSEQAFSFVCL